MLLMGLGFCVFFFVGYEFFFLGIWVFFPLFFEEMLVQIPFFMCIMY